MPSPAHSTNKLPPGRKKQTVSPREERVASDTVHQFLAGVTRTAKSAAAMRSAAATGKRNPKDSRKTHWQQLFCHIGTCKPQAHSDRYKKSTPLPALPVRQRG